MICEFMAEEFNTMCMGMVLFVRLLCMCVRVSEQEGGGGGGVLCVLVSGTNSSGY